MKVNRIHYISWQNGFRQGMSGSFIGRQRKCIEMHIDGEMWNDVELYENSIFSLVCFQRNRKQSQLLTVSIFSSVKMGGFQRR